MSATTTKAAYMQGPEWDAAIERYREGCGYPAAQKRGRNPVFPYVPVIQHPTGIMDTTRREQVLGRAYVTAGEAIAEAKRIIDARVAHFERQINTRGARALREQYSLPRELPAATAPTGAA